MFKLFYNLVIFITIILINISLFNIGEINYPQVIPNLILSLTVIFSFQLVQKLENLPSVYNKVNTGLLLIIISQANLVSFFITNQPLYFLTASEILIKLPGVILVLIGFYNWLKIKEERERILEEQEEKWKSIVEGVNDIIVIVQDGKIKYANPQVRKLLGFEAEEIIGKNTNWLIPDRDMKKIYNDILEQKHSSYCINIVNKSRKIKKFEIIPSVIHYEGKSAMLLILRDITFKFEKEKELLKTKEQLEEIKEKLYEAQKLAGVGYWEVYLPEMRFYISEEALKMVCEVQNSCIKTFDQFTQLITPEHRKKVKKLREDAVRELKPYETEYTISTPNGVKILKEKVKIMEDAEGNRFLLGIIQDITNIHNMYQKILENEERYRNLFEYSNDAIIITDLEGKILDVNQKAIYKTGYTKIDLSFLNIKNIFDRKFSKVYPQWLKKIYINQFLRFETKILTNDGYEFPAEVSASIFEIKDKKYIQFIIRDITERKLAEKELKLASIVFDNALEGIVITDSEGNILRTNRGLTEITGFEKGELLSWHITEFPIFQYKKEILYSAWNIAKKSGKWQGELLCTRKNGENFPALVSVIQVKNKETITNYIVMISDITKRKYKEMKLKNLAYYDNLTKLPNRTYFFSKLKNSIDKAQEEGTKIALLFIDLDGFKGVNDTYGHEYGDKLLIEVAKRLKSSVRKNDFVARLAGDEFVILIENVSDKATLHKISQKIISNIGEPYLMNGKEIKVGASIGISIIPDDANDIETFLKHADFAMYHSKLTGKNRFTFYSDISDKID